MKVLLYFESENLLKTSGIGRALRHQMIALESVGVDYTTEAEEPYDILHINTFGFNSGSMIAKARKEGKPVVYHAHSTEEDFKNSFIFSNQISPYFKKRLVSLYTQADEIITPTPYSKMLLENYGIVQNVSAISNGIELARFQKNAEKVKAYRKYFNLQDNDKVILSVGLYFERKGIFDFIEIAKQRPEYKFIWFGYTNLILVPKAIQDIILNHPRNVIFPGYVKGPIIEGAYEDANCFFFPSYEETEGIVVLEALAAKQKVILRDIEVFNPWLIHGVHCFKANSNDAFLLLIDRACRNELPDITDKAYAVAQSRSLENIGRELLTVYNRVWKNEKNI